MFEKFVKCRSEISDSVKVFSEISEKFVKFFSKISEKFVEITVKLEVIRLNHIQLWIDALAGDREQLLQQIEGSEYSATMDFPGIVVFDDLLKVKYESKNIFTKKFFLSEIRSAKFC